MTLLEALDQFATVFESRLHKGDVIYMTLPENLYDALAFQAQTAGMKPLPPKYLPGVLVYEGFIYIQRSPDGSYNQE